MRVQLLSHTDTRLLSQRLEESGFEPTAELLRPHASFIFALERISRACSHQLVRHRVASYSQQSQRYVEERLGDNVVIPASIRTGLSTEKEFDELVTYVQSSYKRLVDQGIPKEDARFVLPNAAATNMVFTMDADALMHFFGLRCCNRAQWEIRQLADRILSEVLRVEPRLFERAGPYCVQRGYCSEGRFSCGKISEVRERYTGSSS